MSDFSKPIAKFISTAPPAGSFLSSLMLGEWRDDSLEFLVVNVLLMSRNNINFEVRKKTQKPVYVF